MDQTGEPVKSMYLFDLTAFVNFMDLFNFINYMFPSWVHCGLSCLRPDYMWLQSLRQKTLQTLDIVERHQLLLRQRRKVD